MTYIISFTSGAKKTLTKLKKSNAKLWKKVERLIHEMADDPNIYDVYDDKVVVLVIKLEGHYDDK